VFALGLCVGAKSVARNRDAGAAVCLARRGFVRCVPPHAGAM